MHPAPGIAPPSLSPGTGERLGEAERRGPADPGPFPTGSEDPALNAPLAHLNGQSPPAPAWFSTAINTPHERAMLDVAGAAIEWLAWGERGKPGLLLFHGNGANADWWRFAAPAWSATHRVVALSWSGMGNSDHRPSYSIDQYVREALAVGETAGLWDNATLPTVMGHSFGGFPAAGLAVARPERFARALILDSPLSPLAQRPPQSRGAPRPHKVYPTLAAALARFRYAPIQPCGNLFITDFIARSSLKEVDSGFTWKFDPALWHKMLHGERHDLLGEAKIPLAILWGKDSVLAHPAIIADMRARAPQGTIFTEIENAHHHVMADQPQALIQAVQQLL
ncbi:alpha/beta fold hydrolase [Sandaracinobacteroides saxicola]|uniref:Alpha/beta hydrolase n=1 Tax=Sandaracinobacteroides saxicola TaxID=2759707 RepID=A0A7G5IHU5_9SPHN|nr:alpha/beta hydrolase [Sandaracinobacteroides saxicola]QMW22937.1 alpha/beta hydrolase [Sandaracinobacteroides saxicola]